MFDIQAKHSNVLPRGCYSFPDWYVWHRLVEKTNWPLRIWMIVVIDLTVKRKRNKFNSKSFNKRRYKSWTKLNYIIMEKKNWKFLDQSVLHKPRICKSFVLLRYRKRNTLCKKTFKWVFVVIVPKEIEAEWEWE